MLLRGSVIKRDARGKAISLTGSLQNAEALKKNELGQVENGRLFSAISATGDGLWGWNAQTDIERIEKNNIRPVSVIACDINGLKLINDYMGHNAGDKLLVQTAILLRNQLRATDCVTGMGEMNLSFHCRAV